MGEPPGPDDACTRCPTAPLLLAVIFPETDDSLSEPPSHDAFPTVVQRKKTVGLGSGVGGGGGWVGGIGVGGRLVGGRLVGGGSCVGSSVGGGSVGSGVSVGGGTSVAVGMGVKVGRCAARVTRARVAVGSTLENKLAVRQASKNNTMAASSSRTERRLFIRIIVNVCENRVCRDGIDCQK